VSTIGVLINAPKLTGYPGGPDLARHALAALAAAGARLLVNEEGAAAIGAEGQAVPEADLGEQADLIVILGGDGTILHGARVAGGRVPLLGARVGGFGFLAEVNLEELAGVAGRIAGGDFQVEERMMLAADVEREGIHLEGFVALNDVVVGKSGMARVLRVIASVDGELLARYPADGLVVATPTGSTAYSLSAGGPIVHPSVEVIVITPISPHTFNARAVVVGREARVTIELAGGQEARLTVDGQVGYPIEAGDRVVVRRAERTTRLVRLTPPSFYGILRARLAWGEPEAR